jgi:gas vesicle protein
MSNRDGFTGGLIVGAAIGGLVGGFVGVLLAKRADESLNAELLEGVPRNGKLRQGEAERIEQARLSLEDKIAQLNHAIDEVRQQLGSVEKTASEYPEETD